MEYSKSALEADSERPNLPPGFRFHPTDEELVVHYLKKKASSQPLPVAIIAEVDLYKYDPWELPAKATFGEQEWYFFSPRDRKYPNGARPNRAATSGYWKATGTDKPVIASSEGNRKVGVKKALVFYGGKPPKGIKTNWIMHEYRLAERDNNRPPVFHMGNKKNSLRLDDWVLCRIYKKTNSNKLGMDHEREDSFDYTVGSISPLISIDGYNQQMTMTTTTTTLTTNNFSMYPELASLAFPMKRILEPSSSWDDDGSRSTDDQPLNKRLQLMDGGDRGGGGGDNSIAALLSQLPPLQQQTMQGCIISDGIFRPPYQMPAETNWYL